MSAPLTLSLYYYYYYYYYSVIPSVSELLVIMSRSITACSRILDMLLLQLNLSRLKLIVVELSTAS